MVRSRLYEVSHLKRLSVVWNHHLHETHVGRRVARVGNLNRILWAECLARLSRCTGQDDWRGECGGCH